MILVDGEYLLNFKIKVNFCYNLVYLRNRCMHINLNVSLEDPIKIQQITVILKIFVCLCRTFMEGP